jgi:hypothetical protein
MKKEYKCEYYVTAMPISDDLKLDGQPIPEIENKLAEDYIIENKWMNSELKNGNYLSEIHFFRWV